MLEFKTAPIDGLRMSSWGGRFGPYLQALFPGDFSLSDGSGAQGMGVRQAGENFYLSDLDCTAATGA